MSKYNDLNQLSNSIEWNNLSDYEKKRYSNLIRNWEVLREVGITPKLPEFLLRKKSASVKTKPAKTQQLNDEYLSKTKFKLFPLPESSKKKEKEQNGFQYETSKNNKHKIQDVKMNVRDLKVKELAKILWQKAECYMTCLESFISKKVQLPSKNETKIKHQRRYPRRNIKNLSYKEENISSDDEFLYCDDCETDYKGACPTHGPMLWVCDRKVPKNASERAALTIPGFLSIGRSSIPKAGLGVWSEVPLSRGMVFGPYKGDITKNRKKAQVSGYSWMVWKGRKPDHYIEGKELDASSWLRYVNCADTEERQNLVAFQYKKKIYYKTYKDVLPFQELLVWYGGKYAADLGIDLSKRPDGEPKRVDGYECDICHSLFTCPDQMERHKKHHRHEGGGKRHACPHCDYSTNKTTSMRDHVATHTGVKAFKCGHCHKGFTQKHHLVSHERIHTGERPFRCDICGRAFNQKSHLSTHCMTHSGHRHYRCPECGKDFTRSLSLQTHKRIHAQQKPYRCPHCDYRSSQSSHLTGHVILRHTRQFPHKCPLCHKGFIAPSAVQKHMQKTHPREQL